MSRKRACALPLFVAIFACGHAEAGHAVAGHAVAGPRVQFALPTARGELFAVPSTNAPTTVVDFFSPSCEPCRRKLPGVVAEESAIRAKGAQLVLVAVLADGETRVDAQVALGRWGVAHEFIVDSAGVSRKTAGIELLPATLVLDAQGGVLLRGDSTTSPAAIVAAIP